MKKMMLACALAAAMGGATAQQAYLGGSFGVTQFSVDCEGATSCDKSDTGYKIYGGYQLDPTWAVEVGYVDFGKAKLSGVASGFAVDAAIESTAVTLAAAARMPLVPGLAGVLRLGIANVETTLKGNVVGFGSGSDSDTKVKPYFGLGLEYSFTKMLRGTISADFTQGEVDGDKGDIHAFMLGVQYGF